MVRISKERKHLQLLLYGLKYEYIKPNRDMNGMTITIQAQSS